MERVDKETGEIINEEEQWKADIRIDAEMVAGKIPEELVSEYGYYHSQSKKYALTSLGMSDIGVRNDIGTVETSIEVTETPISFSVRLLAKNFKTGVTRFGSATELKFEEGKFAGKKIPEDFKPPANWELHKFSNIHALPTAVTRAEKNGIDKLITADLKNIALKEIEEADKNSDYPKNPAYKNKSRGNSSPQKEPEPKPDLSKASQLEGKAKSQARKEALEAYDSVKGALEEKGITPDIFKSATCLHFGVGSIDELELKHYRQLKEDLTDGFANWIWSVVVNVSKQDIDKEQADLPTGVEPEKTPAETLAEKREERHASTLDSPD